MPDPISTRVVIRRMGANCPKPDGWFTCLAKMRGEYEPVWLKGKTDLPLAEKMKLDVSVVESGRQMGRSKCFDVLEMKPVTDSSQNTVAYLSSFPGIGRTTAAKVADAYGPDAVSALMSDPDAVADKAGISRKTARNLARLVSEPSAANRIRQLLPEVRSAQMVKRIKEVVGTPEALEAILKDDPYRLKDMVPGLSFHTVDQVALRLLDGDALCPYRVNHGLVHLLETKATNDLYLDMDDPRQLGSLQWELESLLSVRFSIPGELRARIEALAAIGDASPVVIDRSGKSARLYLRSTMSDVESFVRSIRVASMSAPDRVSNARMSAAVKAYESSTGFRLTDEQRTAVANAVENRVSVITGGPGRGKTTIVDCVADLMSGTMSRVANGNFPSYEVVLLAPTGRAMAKLQAATGKKHTAMTIDKLLVMAKSAGKSGRPMPFKDSETMFIVDETSMVDLSKLAALFRAEPAARYCLIGDTDQLPPIGRGRVLRDLIDSGTVPVARLTKPLRNGGKILENAERIIIGDQDLRWDLSQMAFYPQQSDGDAMLDTVIDVYAEELRDASGPNEVALLAPMRKGPSGVGRLNLRLQELSCPEMVSAPVVDPRRCAEAYTQRGHPIASARYYAPDGSYTNFRIGDMVMNVKNNYDVELVRFSNDDFWNGTAMDRQAGIFNGDVGRIIAYYPRMSTPKNGDCEFVVVQLSNGLVAQLNLTMGDFENFELAYAMTVHKAQGCEYETVIYVSPDAMSSMASTGFANRNIVYTAVTRAKRKVVVVGSKDSVNACIAHGLPRCNSDLAMRLAVATGVLSPAGDT